MTTEEIERLLWAGYYQSNTTYPEHAIVFQEEWRHSSSNINFLVIRFYVRKSKEKICYRYENIWDELNVKELVEFFDYITNTKPTFEVTEPLIRAVKL
jgi:hypothetical protein